MIEVQDGEQQWRFVIAKTECRRKDRLYRYIGLTRADAIKCAAALRKQGHEARAIPPRKGGEHYSVKVVKRGEWRTRKVKA